MDHSYRPAKGTDEYAVWRELSATEKRACDAWHEGRIDDPELCAAVAWPETRRLILAALGYSA